MKTAGLAIAATASLPALAAPKSPAWRIGCRDTHLKVTGIANPWQAMKAVGAEVIEAQVGMALDCPGISQEKKYSISNAEELERLNADMQASGCRIGAFMMANRFDEQLEAELKWAENVIRAAMALNVPAIRIDVVPRRLKEEEFLLFAIDACKKLCALAEGTPVKFGIENHGKVTNDPVFLRRLFDGVGSDKLGLTLDTANFYWWGHPEKDLYGIYEELAGRACHTHFKSIRYPAEMRNQKRTMGWEYGKHAAPIDEGDIDIPRVLTILRKANYQGDLCIEDESLNKHPKEKQPEVLKRQIDYLRTNA